MIQGDFSAPPFRAPVEMTRGGIQDLNNVPDIIPALDRIADTAPAVAEVTAALVPVFFFVEELFCVFRVDVVLLTAVPEEEPL